METSNELKQLLKEKKELERRIQMLTTGALIRDNVKLDRIGFAGKFQNGKWALFYKYVYVANVGCPGVPESRNKWQPMINGDTVEDVIKQIPDAIKALTDLYEEATLHGQDT